MRSTILKDNIKLLIIIIVFFLNILMPVIQASPPRIPNGFDKGPSFTNVIPLKKATFVGLNEVGLLDDYAYLAAVPTTVFYEDSGKEKKLLSNPLLYYQDSYSSLEDKDRIFNARQGIDYFMDDWLGYSNGRFDQLTLINVPKNKVDQWPTQKYNVINGEDPFSIANSIAIHDWSYSDNVVISVIEKEYQNPQIRTTETTTGKLNPYSTEKFHFQKEPPTIGIGSTYQEFEITDETYKYIAAKLSWIGDIYYDIQLIDEQLGMVSVAMGTRAGGGPLSQEIIGGTSYIHNYGKWRTDITAVPMKSGLISESSEFTFDSFFSSGILSRLRENLMDIEITLYPGTTIPLTVQPPFGCRDVDIKLSWDEPQINLGFTLLDPSGNEIASSVSDNELFTGEITNENSQASIHINRLGECCDDDYYSICVFSLEDVTNPVDFSIDYSWNQNYSKEEGDGLVSATNSAVLASMLNAPLLYVSPNKITSETKDVLFTLGIKNIYLSDLGSHLSKEIIQEIKEIAPITKHYTKANELYQSIRKISQKDDVIFSTIEPWNYWFPIDRKPSGIKEGSLHLGPAAYIAAHHGSPVLLIDYHPKLSQAATWSVDWWIKNAVDRLHGPPSANMVLTAKRSYEFLEENDFGQIEEKGSEMQDQEIIITVADQFQIGIPWDRAFLGAALPGRFWGSPVDVSYSICRSIFYPALVFENPAMGQVTLTQGSSSTTNQIVGSRLKKPFGVNLAITEEMEEEKFQYPVLHMYNTYVYRFNQEASNHWDFIYTRADGITPYITPSPDDIDEGAAITKSGKYYPDLSESEVIPFYAEKAGYENVFSTNFEYVTKNLNRGVLIWVVNSHGWHKNAGMLSYWNPDSPYVFEENPWRAYEPVALKPGSLGKYLRSLPIHYKELLYSDDQQFEETSGRLDKLLNVLGFTRKIQLLPEIASTEHPDASAINFQLERWQGLTSGLRMKIMFPESWNARGIIIYRNILERLQKNLPLINWYNGDGKITSHYATGHFPAMTWHNGYEIDDTLGNLHSVAINAISCMPSNTYMHLSWMRHGALYQIMDPWTTTDWASVWQQMMLKRYALGDTVGEAYERGMQAAGPLYSIGQWWWDAHENVCLFGNPNQRVFVPNTEFSDKNHWTQTETQSLIYSKDYDFNGHMPFGATSYPHHFEPAIMPFNWILIGLLFSIVSILAVVIYLKKAGKKEFKRK